MLNCWINQLMINGWIDEFACLFSFCIHMFEIHAYELLDWWSDNLMNPLNCWRSILLNRGMDRWVDKFIKCRCVWCVLKRLKATLNAARSSKFGIAKRGLPWRSCVVKLLGKKLKMRDTPWNIEMPCHFDWFFLCHMRICMPNWNWSTYFLTCQIDRYRIYVMTSLLY